MNSHRMINRLLQADLTRVIEEMVDYADMLDQTYMEKPNNYIMKFWQFQGVTLKQALLMDLLDWLCFLSITDGFIAREEVQFINIHLKQRFSVNEIRNLCNERIDRDYINRLPLSFILILENDIIMNSIEKRIVYNTIEKLYTLFNIIGIQFIHCDNNVDINELTLFKRYTDDLHNRIMHFDLKSEEIRALQKLTDEMEYENQHIDNINSINNKTFDDYFKELSMIELLENMDENNLSDDNETIMDNNLQFNQWQNNEIKTNNVWDLELNSNDEYNFVGEFDNHLTEFREIFTRENHHKLNTTVLTINEYKNILNKIKSTSNNILNKCISENNIDFNSLSILEKVLLFTKSFVDVDYKAGGADLGNYAFNKINLDDRLDTANQITTLIHELSHHLLAEIFEQTVMIILDSDKTEAIESYVGFSLLISNIPLLLNEYCAHTVQGRFTPHGYQNYGSFENILQRFNPQRDYEIVSFCMRAGNTFCQDLLSIIEPFIDYNLREEIKQQFKKDFSYPPNYRGISLEIKETIDIDDLLSFINCILLDGFNDALENPKLLLDFKKQFKLNNIKR